MTNMSYKMDWVTSSTFTPFSRADAGNLYAKIPTISLPIPVLTAFSVRSIGYPSPPLSPVHLTVFVEIIWPNLAYSVKPWNGRGAGFLLLPFLFRGFVVRYPKTPLAACGGFRGGKEVLPALKYRFACRLVRATRAGSFDGSDSVY